jgi:hypothetical protein
MPRFARLHCPGAVVHVIARFVNRAYRLASPLERAAFLERVPSALARSDWTLCAYALMSSHVHLAMIAGQAPPWHFLKPMHIAFARFINRSDGTLGPVFAERAATIVMPAERMADLVAYIHNNPVRAGVVGHPAESTWTSHRAWIGIEPRPNWLGVERGLHLAGFDDSDLGRKHFGSYVEERSGEPRDPTWAAATQTQLRARIRKQLGLPVEISSPAHRPDAVVQVHLASEAGPVAWARWDGDLGVLLREVSQQTGIAMEELCSRSHRPKAIQARRLAVMTGVRLLRREVNEMAAALGIANSSASRLLRDGDAVMERAREVAVAIRVGGLASGERAGGSGRVCSGG